MASESTFYKLHVHGYTNEFMRRGIPLGSFTFFNQKEDTYGVKCIDVFSNNPNIEMRSHLPMSAADLTALSQIMSIEHPLPKFVSCIQNIGAQIGLKDTLKYKINPDENTSVYTDLYIHPNRVSSSDVRGLNVLVRNLGARFVHVVEETDTNSVEFTNTRIRLFW